MAINIAATRVSLKGVRKGDATSVAIMLAPGGSNSRKRLRDEGVDFVGKGKQADENKQGLRAVLATGGRATRSGGRPAGGAGRWFLFRSFGGFLLWLWPGR